MPLPMEGTAMLYEDFSGVPFGENPLYDEGRWGQYSTRPPLMRGNTGDGIHGTVEFAVNGSLYLAQIFQGDVIEAWGCAPGAGLGAANESQRIVALTDPDNYVGYSSGYGGGIGEAYFFREYDGGDPGAFNTLGEVGAPGPSTGLGIRITPTHVQQWGFHTGVWNLIQEFPDTTHRGPMWIALETEEQGGIAEVGWTCFAASVINRTQIYRVVRGLVAT